LNENIIHYVVKGLVFDIAIGYVFFSTGDFRLPHQIEDNMPTVQLHYRCKKNLGNGAATKAQKTVDSESKPHDVIVVEKELGEKWITKFKLLKEFKTIYGDHNAREKRQLKLTWHLRHDGT
jgi:hypothetical protein